MACIAYNIEWRKCKVGKFCVGLVGLCEWSMSHWIVGAMNFQKI